MSRLTNFKSCPLCGSELKVYEGTIYICCTKCDFEESIYEIVAKEIEALEQENRNDNT